MASAPPILATPLMVVGYNRHFKSGDELLIDAGAFLRANELVAGFFT